MTVPLTKVGDFFYGEVRINGKRFRFTLETGASFTAISTRAAAALGMKPDSMELVPGSGTPVVQIESLALGGATFTGLAARVTSQFDGSGFDGIISVPLLRNLLWTLDLGASRLVLAKGSLPPVDGREILPIAGQDRGGRIDVALDIGGQSAAAVFDSRYADWIMGPDSLIPRLVLGSPPQSLGAARGPTLGSFQMQGARLTGAVTLGSYSVPRAPIVFRNRPGAIVGVAFLEQFIITVDQPNGRLRFQRPSGRDIVVIPLPWEQSRGADQRGPQPQPAGGAPLRPGDRTLGFRLAGIPNGRLNVVQLVPGSAAYKIGIRENDEIAEFDGTAATAMNPSVFRTALARDGPVKVVVLRDGKRLEFSVEPHEVPSSSSAQGSTQSSDTALARAITAYVDAESAANRFSGVVMVAKRGEAIVELARGSANRRASIANTAATRFQLASGDKWFTKIAISQLIASGKVAMTDTVGKFLAQYPSATVRSKVTVEQLLMHRSGLGMYWNDAYLTRRESLKTLEDVVSLFSREERAFTPGERQQYSNNGYVLPGRIVEVASGMSYYDHVQQRIFAPAGMTRTAYLTLNDWPADKAIGYTVEGSAAAGGSATRNAATQAVENTRSLAFHGSPAGGGYSTSRDLLRLDAALRRGEIGDTGVLGRITARRITATTRALSVRVGRLWRVARRLMPIGRAFRHGDRRGSSTFSMSEARAILSMSTAAQRFQAHWGRSASTGSESGSVSPTVGSGSRWTTGRRLASNSSRGAPPRRIPVSRGR